MISKLLALVPDQWKIGLSAAAILALVAGLGGVYLKGHADGAHQSDLEWTVKYEERERQLSEQRFQEIDRQAMANDAAKAAEAAELAEYADKIATLEALVEDLSAEAEADPDAGRIALDAQAVSRYNRRISR